MQMKDTVVMQGVRYLYNLEREQYNSYSVIYSVIYI